MRSIVPIILLITTLAFADGALSPQPVLDSALEAAEKGRLTESLTLYKKLQQSGYDSAALSYNIAAIAIELRDYGTAIHQARRAARSYPLKSQFQFQLAQARTLSGGSAEFKPSIDLDFST